MYGTIFQHVYETCFQSVFHVHTWHVRTAPDVTNVDNALRVVSVELQTMLASADISFPVSSVAKISTQSQTKICI